MSEPNPEKRKNWTLRLSPSERATLEEKAASVGLKLSPYLREAGLKKTIQPKNPIPEINRATYVELGRIGNNINQIAKAAHISIKRGTGCNVNPHELSALLTVLKEIRLQVLAISDNQKDDRETD